MANFCDNLEELDINVPGDLADVSRPDPDGWWEAVPGRAANGNMVGAFKYRNKKGQEVTVGLLLLKQPCIARALESDKNNPQRVKLDAGDVLGVTITYQLREILNYIEKKGEVYFKCTGTKELAQGTMNLYDIKGDPRAKSTAPEMQTVSNDFDSSF
jgi:hypothetical protein